MSAGLRPFRDLFSSGRFYGTDTLFDGSVRTEDGLEFKVHKLILSRGSNFFKASFRSNLEDEIVIRGVDGTVVENVLVFLYTGEVHLNAKNIASVLMAADYLLVDNLLAQCRSFALQHISLECCVPLLVASWFVERLGMAESCYRFVQVYFENITTQHRSSIATLPADLLKKLLRDNSICVSKEETVWDAIVVWVSGDVQTRLRDVPDLVSCIKWGLLESSTQLRIATHPFCKDLNIEKLSRQLEFTRCPRKMYMFLCSMPFPYSSETLDVFLTYDEQIDIWRKVGETDTNFHRLIPMNTRVFMFNVILNKIEAFDLIRKFWSCTTPLGTVRQCYRVQRSQDRIYAIGGYRIMRDTQLPEVEYYQQSRNKWLRAKPVPFANISGSAVVDDKLYVIGYLEEAGRLEMQATVYDSASDSWLETDAPKRFRYNFAIITFKDQMYILGGRTETDDIVTSVETYNAADDKWTAFTALPLPYIQPKATVLKDKLMVYDDATFPVFSPSVWDEEASAWQIVHIISPLQEIHRYQFCIIDDPLTLKELFKENRQPSIVWKKTPFTAY